MRIICIGAGPAGLFFSINASLRGHEVTLLESNDKVGRKLAITGKGRCNITNKRNPDDFIAHVISNPKFLYSSINGFAPEDTIRWFESHNCPLKVERGNRVFPVSDKAYDIVDTLLRECRRSGVNIRCSQKVIDIKKEGDIFKIKTKDSLYESDALVIATGGKSYPLTGSKGDGYRFAESFGHTITPLRSALCPIRIKEKIYPEMVNFTLKNVSLSVRSGIFHETLFGDMEFLPDVITGPISISMSSLINKFDNVDLSLDFKPALDKEKLDARLIREIKAAPNKDVYYLIKKLLPEEMINFFVSNTNIELSQKLNSLTKEERASLVGNLKEFKLTYLGLDDIEKGIVTSGGIKVSEINQKTMESKLVEHLYFIGEILDVDAYTGGYSLQISLSTGYAAGNNI